MGQSTPNRTALAGLCALAVGVLLNFLLAEHHAGLLQAAGCRVDGVMAVTNNDGYYHLNHARLFAAQGTPLAGLWSGSMLLSRLLAFLGGTDIPSLLAASAPLGPILGLTMLLAVLPWAMDTKAPAVAVLAPLLALLSPYWIDRTHLGAVDTDALAPFLAYASLYCVMRLSIPSRRLAWAAGYAALLVLQWLWWKPGAFLAAGFLGCHLLHWPRQRGDATVKLTLLAAIACATALALARVWPFADWYDYTVAHISLAFGGAEGALLSNAIMELHPLTLAELGDRTLGSAWLLLLLPPGFILYAWRFGWKSLFLLLPGAAFGIFALLSRRFIPFFVPAAALLTVYCAVEVCRLLAARMDAAASGWKLGRYGALAVFTVLLFSGAGAKAVEYAPESYFSSPDFTLAREMKQAFPQDTLIWTWWDYGYFYQFLTGMPVYFDGGSQTDASCFVAAYPLMQSDQRTAARWIRYFASHRDAALDLSRRGKQWPQYVTELMAGMREKTNGTLSVALCLPARVYTTVGYLYAFAHVFDEHPPAVANHLDLFEKGDFRHDRDAGAVVVPQAVMDKGYTGFGSVLDLTGKEPAQFDFAALPDPYLTHSGNTDFLAVTDRAVVRSVLFRLLGQYRADPTFFEPVRAFGLHTGGLWRVVDTDENALHTPGAREETNLQSNKS
ncbi:Oligosaccharyl transferase STT3 subunit [Pseudodesulfovibrio mercurii]|uniref:Oligosaccharyl transferase STT3 subunit n=1 Tax=Pseudodesulfovibrio mercurii TaxID=641491 RepID=F0JDY5_9BACT|nr:oligosaccharyl transferase STT3 subunit [Pseudodesulfovibrio mercurii]EGB13425.1 Oligosaccharyl transferase STT3 subunit [Pseudodesulfovibrio mercurii]